MNTINFFSLDSIGYLAIIVNLYSMLVKGEKRLRLISTIANSIFILYGILLGAMPIIVGSCIAVFLHSYHLRRIRKDVE